MTGYRSECDGCGLSAHDLPDELGDRNLVLEQFFEYDGHLYCQGCIAAGLGVFL